MSPLAERPIALETGRVLKQREMQARLTLKYSNLLANRIKFIWILATAWSSAGDSKFVNWG